MAGKFAVIAVILLAADSFGPVTATEGPENRVEARFRRSSSLTNVGSAVSGSLFSLDFVGKIPEANFTVVHPTVVAVRSTIANLPLPDVQVSWSVLGGSATSGWVFPITRTSDGMGLSQAWWVAGAGVQQTLAASVDNSVLYFAGIGTDTKEPILNPGGTFDYVPDLLNKSSPHGCNGISVEITVQSLPEDAKIVVGSWQGGFLRADPDGVLLSVGSNSSIDDAEDASNCTDHPGGKSECWLPMRVNTSGLLLFELELDHGQGNETDVTYISAVVKDLNEHKILKIGRIRYSSRVFFTEATGKVEVESEKAAARNCLKLRPIAFYYGNAKYREASTGKWISSRSSEIWPGSTPSCHNRLFAARNGRFFFSSGGDQDIGFPVDVPGNRPPIRLSLDSSGSYLSPQFACLIVISSALSKILFFDA